jgi:F-type H+-transporting ATPase subunit a
MASDILHIKDSYYFEIPKVLAPAKYASKADYPEHLNVWVRLDDQFQKWEFEKLYHELDHLKLTVPDEHQLEHEWEHWSHGHDNHGKPFDVYLEEHAEKLLADYKAWSTNPKTPENKDKSFDDYLKVADSPAAKDFAWFATKYEDKEWRSGDWATAKKEAGGKEAVAEFKALKDKWDWSEEKLASYNHHLSGKLLIPQPFGELRNFYQPESGFAISKFMIIQLVVGMILLVAFSWVARKIASGQAPKGRLWNLLETFLVFIRDQVAAPAIGGEHHDEDDHALDHDAHGHKLAQGASSIQADAGEELSPGHGPHGAHAHHKTKGEISDERRFTPVLWTIFFFVLLCNLFGMLPWAGSPTASFSVTLALALVTFSCVVLGGMRKFGFLGFFKNQVPSMDLPIYMAVVLIPMIFAIEMLGLLIKHGVLAIRLLANMVAGHLVILGVMGLAFGATAAINFHDAPSWQWPLVATIAVVGSTLFNILELFVAFLQAYVFTFLSALFIGASVHKH